MRYLSVCSGIEAATVAWHPLGWTAAAYSEIEAFPRAVLSHHYPDTPLHGDFTTIGADEYGPIDLLVGGTPCQSFSVAGLRGGLADERGNLALQFLKLADRTRARWVVWENVPGVLSSNGGRDFGSILGGLVELGYGYAYRVLDAQFFGVPQRRRRVFVVGHLGDWRRAAAVLFERHSLSGHPAPRRQAGERVARTLKACSGKSGTPNGAEEADRLVASTGDVSHCLNAGGMGRQDYETETLIAHCRETAGTLTSNYGKQPDSSDTGLGPNLVAFNLRGREDGAQPEADPDNLAAMRAASGGSSRSYIAFTGGASDILTEENCAQPVTGRNGDPGMVEIPLLEIGKGTTSRGVGPNGSGLGNDGDPMFTLQAGAHHGVGTHSAVRRLTPRECERLQGFPDDYTLIPYRGKPAADGPRYKALGNSMAVPVMRWIGERIAKAEALAARADAA